MAKPTRRTTKQDRPARQAKRRPEGTQAMARGDAAPAAKGRKLPPRYPNMEALRELEHAQHVKRAMDMGLTRKQAEGHARRDEAEGASEERANRRTAKSRAGTSL